MRRFRSVLLLTCFVTGTVGCESTPSSLEDPVAQAVLVFDGHLTPQQLRPVFNQAMSLYGLERNAANYESAASVLYSLKKANGTSEMAILDYMIRSHVDGVAITFASAAGISSAALRAGLQ